MRWGKLLTTKFLHLGLWSFEACVTRLFTKPSSNTEQQKQKDMSNTSNTQTHKNKETLRAFLWPRPLEMSLTWVRNLVKKDTTHCYRGLVGSTASSKQIKTNSNREIAAPISWLVLHTAFSHTRGESTIQPGSGDHSPAYLHHPSHWLDWAGIINTFHHLLFKAFRYCIVVLSLLFFIFL